MKIIHVITSFALGGAERVACDLSTGQVAQGHDVSIIALRRTPQDQQQFGAAMRADLEQKNVKAIGLDGRNFRTSVPYLVFSLLRIIRREKSHILHAHADPADFIVSLASRLAHTSVVRTIHNTVIWPTHSMIGWIAEHAFKGEYVVACSKDAMTAYEKTRIRFGLKPTLEREIIYNGVPLVSASVKRELPQARLKFAFFGRNTAQKGLDTLCEAITIVGQRNRTSLRIDLYTDATAGEISISDDEKVIHNLYSPTPNARKIMGNYDALIVPSRFEGFPLVPLEAMASSVPIIVTDAPGLREVTPPGWPLLLPVGNASALADIIDEIGRGKHDLQALGKRARTYVEQFSLETQVDRYLEVYKKLLAPLPTS